jgi:hypothetical protein
MGSIFLLMNNEFEAGFDSDLVSRDALAPGLPDRAVVLRHDVNRVQATKVMTKARR